MAIIQESNGYCADGLGEAGSRSGCFAFEQRMQADI